MTDAKTDSQRNLQQARECLELLESLKKLSDSFQWYLGIGRFATNTTASGFLRRLSASSYSSMLKGFTEAQGLFDCIFAKEGDFWGKLKQHRKNYLSQLYSFDSVLDFVEKIYSQQNREFLNLPLQKAINRFLHRPDDTEINHRSFLSIRSRLTTIFDILVKLSALQPDERGPDFRQLHGVLDAYFNLPAVRKAQQEAEQARKEEREQQLEHERKEKERLEKEAIAKKQADEKKKIQEEITAKMLTERQIADSMFSARQKELSAKPDFKDIKGNWGKAIELLEPVKNRDITQQLNLVAAYLGVMRCYREEALNDLKVMADFFTKAAAGIQSIPLSSDFSQNLRDLELGKAYRKFAVCYNILDERYAANLAISRKIISQITPASANERTLKERELVENARLEKELQAKQKQDAEEKIAQQKLKEEKRKSEELERKKKADEAKQVKEEVAKLQELHLTQRKDDGGKSIELSSPSSAVQQHDEATSVGVGNRDEKSKQAEQEMVEISGTIKKKKS